MLNAVIRPNTNPMRILWICVIPQGQKCTLVCTSCGTTSTCTTHTHNKKKVTVRHGDSDIFVLFKKKLVTYLHAQQTLGCPGSVCRTSGRFCTACARNISAAKKDRADFKSGRARAPPGCCTIPPRAFGKSASNSTGPSCCEQAQHHMHHKHCLLNSPVSMRL